MRKWFIAGVIGLSLMFLTAAGVYADVIILKNGQVIKDAAITEEGDILSCETSTQSFYIHKSAVENIIRTGNKSLFEQIKEFIKTLPLRVKMFVKNYFAVAATVVCGLVLMLGLLAFKFLWVNIRPVMGGGIKRRQINYDIKHLDADEKSVLREFFLQKANTLEMPVEDSVVSGLIRKGILETTRDQGQYSICGLLLPVALSSAAGKRIQPRTVGLPPDIHALDEKRKDELARSRPQFMYDMAGFYQSLKKNRTDRR
ncbi:MAG: super-infection exclusion protein B [Desulfobacteraceae bacterium]|nr:super-infection exclusion protein B [Desulfobacteraceae bacterium]